MTGDGDIRASDSDRENTVALLQDAHAEGRLTLDEFDERMNAAYSARTWGILRELTRDLPADPALGPGHRTDLMPRAIPYRPGAQPSRGPFPGPVLPLALIWIALAGAAHPATAVTITAVLFIIMWVRLTSRNHHRRGHGPDPGGPA